MNRTLQYKNDLQSYPNFEKREITKSYSGFERDNSKPDEEVSCTTFEQAVYMQFVL